MIDRQVYELIRCVPAKMSIEIALWRARMLPSCRTGLPVLRIDGVLLGVRVLLFLLLAVSFFTFELYYYPGHGLKLIPIHI